jgi:hypothetical protein
METLNFSGRQRCLLAYRVVVARNDGDLNPETLKNTGVFSGYYVKLPNPARAKFLALAKADVLKTNPLVTNKGKYPIRVFLVNEESKEEKLIFDSTGTTKEIQENLKHEAYLYRVYSYGFDFEVVKDEDGNDFQCIKPDGTINRLKSEFFTRLTDDDLQIPSFDERIKLMSNLGARLELKGIKRVYKHYGLITTLL